MPSWTHVIPRSQDGKLVSAQPIVNRGGSMTYFHDRRNDCAFPDRDGPRRSGGGTREARRTFTRKGWSPGVSNFAAGRLPSSVWSRNTAHTCQERRCAAPRYNEPGKPVAFARARAYVQIDSLSLYLYVTLCEPRAAFPLIELSRCRGCGLYANINFSRALPFVSSALSPLAFSFLLLPLSIKSFVAIGKL